MREWGRGKESQTVESTEEESWKIGQWRLRKKQRMNSETRWFDIARFSVRVLVSTSLSLFRRCETSFSQCQGEKEQTKERKKDRKKHKHIYTAHSLTRKGERERNYWSLFPFRSRVSLFPLVVFPSYQLVVMGTSENQPIKSAVSAQRAHEI